MPLPRPPLRRLARAAAGVATTLAMLGSLPACAADLTVSAAASLGNAFKDLAGAFEAAHPGTRLQFNIAASGALLQQIAKGAPVDVFASADQETMDQAQALGLVKPGQRRNLASNALVLVVPAATARTALAAPTAPTARVPATLADLAQPAVQRVAIGLPASVPAGRYAKAALEAEGLWAAVAPKMIGAQSVRQALDYVARGEVDAGFVYATDAALMPDKVTLALTVATARPVLYPVAVVAPSPNAALAQQFVDYLLAPPAQAVLARHGFGKP